MKKEIIEYAKYNKSTVIKIIVMVVLVLVALFSYMGKDSPGEIVVANPVLEQNETTFSPAEATTDTFIYVDVSGAVNKPGVLKLKSDTRVYQAIEMAGGLKKDASTVNINMAAKLDDEVKLYVPESSEVHNSLNTNSQQISFSQNDSDNILINTNKNNASININSAESQELQQLPGIGPSTAEKIIDYRNDNGKFEKIEDIKNVSGIGDKTFAKFKDKISI